MKRLLKAAIALALVASGLSLGGAAHAKAGWGYYGGYYSTYYYGAYYPACSYGAYYPAYYYPAYSYPAFYSVGYPAYGYSAYYGGGYPAYSYSAYPAYAGAYCW